MYWFPDFHLVIIYAAVADYVLAHPGVLSDNGIVGLDGVRLWVSDESSYNLLTNASNLTYSFISVPK